MAGLNTLVRKTERAKTRVGRGGKRGKTAGRGTKGQNARAGHKKRPEWRDIIKKLPKRRGYGKNRARTVNSSNKDAVAISLDRLEALFENGAEITSQILVSRGLVSARKKLPIKLVNGTLSKKLTIKSIATSASARAAIEKVGGTIS